ncbi:MAG TPA: YqgE/AlgH family protein [Saprospiraceae bacterium]|nr:YqgE/AlgH family protein [Saprospiraceae bacterium]
MKVDVNTGNVLLAEPFMLDPHFKRSVIILCEYSRDEGTVGFILNKVISTTIHDVIDDFPTLNAPVYYGGPVGKENLFYIHNVGQLLEESMEVMPGLYWGGNFEKLKFLISSGLITEKNIRFFIGYSGWSPGQLEAELDSGSWVISDMHPNYAFKSKPKYLWRQVMKDKGDNYTVIAQMPDSFILN